MRNAAHKLMERRLGRKTSMDVDHIIPLSKGGRNKNNLRLRSRRANRSFKRNKDGSMA